MKVYRTRYPDERLNVRYIDRKRALRVAARGTAAYINLPPPAALMNALLVLIAVAVILGGTITAFSEGKKASERDAGTLLTSTADFKPTATETTVRAPEPQAQPEPTEEPEPVSRYADIVFTEEEEYILACLVYHEARGEPFEGQVAVVEVVFNRMLSPYFPDTVEEVVFQKYGDIWQFSPAPYLYTAEPSETNYSAVWVAYHGSDPVTTLDTVYFSGGPYNEHISAIIGNHYFCEIG